MQNENCLQETGRPSARSLRQSKRRGASHDPEVATAKPQQESNNISKRAKSRHAADRRREIGAIDITGAVSLSPRAKDNQAIYQSTKGLREIHDERVIMQRAKLAQLSKATEPELMWIIKNRFKFSYKKLFKSKPGIFDLKDFVFYYHECAKRKGVVSMINAASGRHALNLSVNLSNGTFKHADKILVSRQKVNVIVCDEPFIREIIRIFLRWRDYQVNHGTQNYGNFTLGGAYSQNSKMLQGGPTSRGSNNRTKLLLQAGS